MKPVSHVTVTKLKCSMSHCFHCPDLDTWLEKPHDYLFEGNNTSFLLTKTRDVGSVPMISLVFVRLSEPQALINHISNHVRQSGLRLELYPRVQAKLLSSSETRHWESVILFNNL